MDGKGETKSSGYLNFGIGGLSTTRWKPKGGPGPENRTPPREQPVSEPREVPTTFIT